MFTSPRLRRPILFAGGKAKENYATPLLQKAPDRIAVLKQFIRRFRPMSWSGSQAAAMETRVPLLRVLESDADPAIAALAKADGARLKSEIEREREQETREDRASDERFE